jgi:GAF domain-containing protein
VGKDAVFFDNPDLPNTRSEIGLPLKVGGRIIGALDAQSTEQSAFSQEDIALLSTLADQVAIAIENARLFSETRRALENVQAAQREYLRTEWSHVTGTRQNIGYEYRQGEIIPMVASADSPGAASKDQKSDGKRHGKSALELAAQPGEDGSLQLWAQLEEIASSTGFIIQRPRSDDVDGAKIDTSQGSGPTLHIPISLRGEIIGVINLSEMNPERVWSEDEISLAKVIAEQVGLALENARLIEETQRRAEREHLVAEITTHLRSSNDPQVILQTAAEELRQLLRSHTAQVIVQSIGSNPASGSTARRLSPTQNNSVEE